MKIARIILAILITLVLFYIARNTSRGRPEVLTAESQGYIFTMVTTPKASENESGRIAVRIDGPLESDMHVILRTGLTTNKMPTDHNDPHQGMIRFRPDPDTVGLYVAQLPVRERGTREYYFIQIRSGKGELITSFARPDGYPFMIKAIGDVPAYVLIGHIVMIFATVFCVTMALFHAISLINGSTDAAPMATWYFWSVVFAFFGCYPFGFGMNWYAFGAIWEGVPFGTDGTDNKTQLLFVYLLFVWLASLASFSKGRVGRDLYRPKILGWIGALGFAVVWFIYLIPHSIQFSAAFTYAFCYSWIGIILAIYVVGLARSGGSGASPRLEPGNAGRD